MRGVVLLALVTACAQPAPPAPASPEQRMGDAAPSACTRACATLQNFGCEESLPTKRGETCEAFCQRVQDDRAYDMRPDCVSAAKSLDDLHVCGTRCRPR